MQFVLILLFVIVCTLLCLVILLQPGKGSGMGAIGGGGAGGSSVFGARGAVGFLGKMTGWLAAAFMVLSLVLARASVTESAVDPSAVRGSAPIEAPAGAGGEAGEEEAPAEGAGEAPAEGSEAAPAEGETGAGEAPVEETE